MTINLPWLCHPKGLKKKYEEWIYCGACFAFVVFDIWHIHLDLLSRSHDLLYDMALSSPVQYTTVYYDLPVSL